MMTSDFKKMFDVLRRLGDVSEEKPTFRNGKPSKFEGVVSSNVGDTTVNLGILHYNWKRSIGVDKVHQAMQQTDRVGLDGVVLIGSKFSKSAIEQAYRINERSSKRILLMETQEIDAAYEASMAR